MAPGKAKALSWKDYAELTGAVPRGECRVCILPAEMLDNIHDAYANGMRSTFMRRYLHACGIDTVTQPMIQNHFSRLHHEAAAP